MVGRPPPSYLVHNHQSGDFPGGEADPRYRFQLHDGLIHHDDRRMAVTNWLIDKSALIRLDAASDEWLSRIQRGLVKISTVTLLEIGFSTRNGADHRGTLSEPPLSLMPIEHLTPAIEARAIEIQTLLADRGQHRAPSIPDLLIAATAELARLTVLHAGKDFDLIATITAQPLERLET